MAAFFTLYLLLTRRLRTPMTNSQPVPPGQDAVIPLRIQIEPLSFTLGSLFFKSSTAQT